MSKLPCVSLFQIFSELYICQILIELVYNWENYHKNGKGELFIETHRIHCTKFQVSAALLYDIKAGTAQTNRRQDSFLTTLQYGGGTRENKNKRKQMMICWVPFRCCFRWSHIATWSAWPRCHASYLTQINAHFNILVAISNLYNSSGSASPITIPIQVSLPNLQNRLFFTAYGWHWHGMTMVYLPWKCLPPLTSNFQYSSPHKNELRNYESVRWYMPMLTAHYILYWACWVARRMCWVRTEDSQ